MKSSAIMLGMMTLSASFLYGGMITNGSFESAGGPTRNLPVSSPLDGWIVVQKPIAICLDCCDGPGIPGSSASDGRISLDLTSMNDSGFGGIRQVIETVPNQVYRLSFDVGARNGTSEVGFQIANEDNSGLFPQYGVLLEGTRVSTSEGQWIGWTGNEAYFTAKGDRTAIALFGKKASYDGRFTGLDNVDVTKQVAVPEPVSTLAFFGIPLATFSILRRLKR